MTLSELRHIAKNVSVGVAAMIVAVPVLAGVFVAVKSVADAGQPSCSSLAAGSAAVDEHVQHFLIEVPGNSKEASAEAAQFVRGHITGLNVPSAVVTVEVHLFSDGHIYGPAQQSPCLGRILSIAANKHDRKDYETARGKQAQDLRASLLAQQQAQLSLLTKAVEAAVQGVPAPAHLNDSALPVWLQAAQIGAVQRLAVLAPFGSGGNDCLTMPDPASSASPPSVADRANKSDEVKLPSQADRRVQDCVSEKTDHALEKVSARHLVVQASQANHPAPNQARAQEALIAALCNYATEHGCSTS